MLLIAIALVGCSGVKEELVFAETDGGVYLKDYRGDGGAVTVPKEYDGKTVVAIGDLAFANTPELCEVRILADNVKVGKYAFSNCPRLEAVVFENGLCELSEGAFYGCSSLTTIDILGINEIPSHCFYNCSSLAGITLGEGIVSIGERAFFGCSSLSSISLPKSLIKIGQRAFGDCTSLASLTFGGSLEMVGEYCFLGVPATIDMSAESKLEGLSKYAFSGYSGGGKGMIAEYADENRSHLLDAPMQYGLGQQHKHLKEMKAICSLANAPLFSPIVGDFYSGMLVSVPLFAKQINGTIEDIKAVYKSKYADELVYYCEHEGDGKAGFASALALEKKDCMRIAVYGNEERILLTAAYDNLGKGASGAAIECMNIALGLPKTKGLEL